MFNIKKLVFVFSVLWALPLLDEDVRHGVKLETFFFPNKGSKLLERRKKEIVSNQKTWEMLVYADFLYLKAIEDSLSYAQKVPQTSTNIPNIGYVSQKFDWDPGFCLGIAFSMPKNQWKLAAKWTYFQSEPGAVSAYDVNYGILAGLSTPVFGSAGNVLVQGVKGDWRLLMNVFDLEMERDFLAGANLKLSPRFGIMGSSISQQIHVHYQNYLIQSPSDNTPQTVIGKSWAWGVGPELGFITRVLLPLDITLYVDGTIAALFGTFHLTTIYKDLLGEPASSRITLTDSLQRMQPYGQILAGISKKVGPAEITVGWEGSIWWSQMRMNWFSTVVLPQDGADLMLNGFFMNTQWQF